MIDEFHSDGSETLNKIEYVEFYLTKFWDDLLWSTTTSLRPKEPLAFVGQDAERARQLFGAQYMPADVLAFIDGYHSFREEYILKGSKKINGELDLENYINKLFRDKNKIAFKLFGEEATGPLASPFIHAIMTRLTREENAPGGGLERYFSYMGDKFDVFEDGKVPRSKEAQEAINKLKAQLKYSREQCVEYGNKNHPSDPVDINFEPTSDSKVYKEDPRYVEDKEYLDALADQLRELEASM